MFNITDEAQIYVADLFAQQDEEGLGLKVDIEKAGTPAAAVTFNFCYEKDLGKTYFKCDLLNKYLVLYPNWMKQMRHSPISN
jgi:Fe-S cluster assembly iron-binding protein IscA